MKLEKGMYVRTKDKKGITYIRKLTKLANEYPQKLYGMEVDKEIHYVNYLSQKNILKASHNIKELIEDDDLIKFKIYGELFICKVYNKSLINYDGEVFDLEELDIVSILTKEQYESMSYKVGE